MRIKTLVCALAMVACVAVHGQFDDGSRIKATPAWSTFIKGKKATVKPNFQNSSIDMIVSWFSKTSGVTIIKDPGLTGTMTVSSAKPVSLNDAFSLFNTILKMKGYSLQKQDNFLVIRQGGRDEGQQQQQPPFDMSKMIEAMSQNQSQLKVYTIQYANANQVARVVNEVFASTPDPMQQIMQQLGGFGGGFGGNNFGGGQRPGQGGNNNRGGGGNPFQNRGGGGNQFNRGGFGNFGRGGFGGGTQVVRASSDDFSNSVIVNAPGKEQQQVENLIRQIDKQTDMPQAAKVYKLEFASSDDLAPVVQNVLTQNAPRGRGGLGSQNVSPQQQFQQAFRFGSAQAAFGTVVSEPRTNALVVTATEENQKLVEQVIKELDTEIKVENTTFVFPLANARADQIATLMQQAFGTRQGLNGQGNRGTNQANRNSTTNRNNQNNRNGGGGGNARPIGLNSETTDPNNMDLNLQDDGSLPTEIAVQQGGFGFGGGFGGQNNRRTTQAQTGRDANGRLVNVRDLQGQITVIPDNNTNSVIVVATPENLEMRGIL